MSKDVLKKEFLAAARAAVRAEREIRRKSFNVFSMCGVDHYENRHSQILKTFLDPQGPCGSIFLKEFFRLQDIDFRITGRTHADTELSTEYGRMDVCIMDATENWCVIIENKVYAGEQRKQIARYGKYLKRFANSRLFFLTRTGYKSSTAFRAEYTPISYAQDISAWIDGCIDISNAFSHNASLITDILKQYKSHIQTLAEVAMDTEEKKSLEKLANAHFQEFQELCEDYKFIAGLRSEVTKKIQQDIVNCVLMQLKGKCALESGDGIDESMVDQNTGFVFAVKGSCLKIRLTAQSHGCKDVCVAVTKEEAKGYVNRILSFCQGIQGRDNKYWLWKNCTIAKDWDSEFYHKWQTDKEHRAKVKREIKGLIEELLNAAGVK